MDKQCRALVMKEESDAREQKLPTERPATKNLESRELKRDMEKEQQRPRLVAKEVEARELHTRRRTYKQSTVSSHKGAGCKGTKGTKKPVATKRELIQLDTEERRKHQKEIMITSPRFIS